LDESLLLLLAGGILAASVVIALGASRVGVSSLVAFLALGMFLGTDGPVGIEFDNVELARTVGIFALVLILFEGGLSTSWRRLRNVAVPAALLSTIGVAVTAVMTGLAARALFELPWLQAFLLGAVVSSTDAAAVFATLRFTSIRLRVARTLEAETGGNDPMAIALTVGLISWILSPQYDITNLVTMLVQQLGIGLLVGLALGGLATWVFSRLPQSLGAFAPVASLAACALSFGVAGVLGGSGFLAVYLVGLAIGSTPSRYRHHMVAFHEGIAFLSQVVLFVVLGLLVVPHELLPVAYASLTLAILLILVIRPIAVWLSVPFSKFSSRERVLLGYAGLRGALPIVLGTIVLSSEVAFKEEIFNVVFFIVLASALIQGATLERLARWLGLVEVERPKRPKRVKQIEEEQPQIVMEYEVAPNDSIAGVKVKEVGLPKRAKIATIKRRKKRFTPTKETHLQKYDCLFVLAPSNLRPEVEDVMSRWRRRI
jgi:potassium/hydrogen antiporter